jgi:hypothetical protein
MRFTKLKVKQPYFEIQHSINFIIRKKQQQQQQQQKRLKIKLDV